jgi:hypothetical protein
MRTLVQMTDADARLTLPSQFANSAVVLEVDEERDTVVLRRAEVQGRLAEQLDSAHAIETKMQVVSKMPVRIHAKDKGQIRVDDRPITHFLKGLGFAGWTAKEARNLLIILSKRSGVSRLADVANKSTVSCQVGDGRKMRRGEQPNHGSERSLLTESQLHALRSLLSS